MHRLSQLSAAYVIFTSLLVISASIAFASGATDPNRHKSPSPTFFNTRDSDQWVTKTLEIQNEYTRVLIVDKSDNPPKRIKAGAPDLNARSPKLTAKVYKVHAVFPTIQAAANAAEGGDLIAVMPGKYAGFWVGDKPSAGDGKYIHFKAMGQKGQVVINKPMPNPPRSSGRGLILFQTAHHVILEGFNIDGKDARSLRRGPPSGIKIEGFFVRTGKTAHHIVILGNFVHHQRSWGMLVTVSHTILLQDNLFAFSHKQHGAYISDSSDNCVVRRNVFFSNGSAGLQCNLDPTTSLSKLYRNPAMRSYRKWQGNRQWATGLLEQATKIFGANNFPDGKGLNFIIENNVINRCGGGGALNLAGVQDSVIQNNLIYDIRAHGIALWNDHPPYDHAQVLPGPRRPEDVTGPGDLPLWGCHGNLVRNNTVLMDNARRAAMQCRHGSWGCKLRNNIFINDKPWSLQVYNTSIYRYDAGYNVVNGISYVEQTAGRGRDPSKPMDESLKSLAIAVDADAKTVAGITRERIAREFVRYGDQPWVVLEGDWWKLNPNRPDFHPKATSKLLAGKGDKRELPALDLAGRRRHSADIGAFCAKEQTEKP